MICAWLLKITSPWRKPPQQQWFQTFEKSFSPSSFAGCFWCFWLFASRYSNYRYSTIRCLFTEWSLIWFNFERLLDVFNSKLTPEELEKLPVNQPWKQTGSMRPRHRNRCKTSTFFQRHDTTENQSFMTSHDSEDLSSLPSNLDWCNLDMCWLKVNIKIHYSKCLGLVKPQTQKKTGNKTEIPHVFPRYHSLIFHCCFGQISWGGALVVQYWLGCFTIYVHLFCSSAPELGGGFKYFFVFIPTWGTDPIWRSYFSDGLKPQTNDNTTLNASVALTGGFGMTRWGWKTWNSPPQKKMVKVVGEAASEPLWILGFEWKRVEVIFVLKLNKLDPCDQILFKILYPPWN